MRLEAIRASSRSTSLFGTLRSSTGVGPEAWARLSICMSLRQKGMPNPDEYNTLGAEIQPSKLFPHGERLYLALIAHRLLQDGLDPEEYLTEMTRAHLNRGAISLKQRISSLYDVYGFMDEMNAGGPKPRDG